MIAKEIAAKIFKAAEDKKAKDILVLDMAGINEVTDYFIICSANSNTQVRAIADNIDEELSKNGYFPKTKEGYADASWVLMDFGYCVVHIFLDEERTYYNLEKLWANAPVVEFEAGK